MTHVPSRARIPRIVGVAVLALAGACSDGPNAPPPVKLGKILVTGHVSGLDELFGFSVRVDTQPPRMVALGAELRLADLTVGSHIVTLLDIPDNCTVDGDNPRTVSVVADVEVPVDVSFSCVAKFGVVEITTTTAGIDEPTKYDLQGTDGGIVFLPVNSVVRLFIAGHRDLRLDGLPTNCSVAGDATRGVDLQIGGTTRDTVRIAFEVSCTAATGVIEITSSYTGEDPDPNGYVIKVDGVVSAGLQVNATTQIRVAGGSHAVTLTDLAMNCSLKGAGDSRTVTISVGGLTRDTVRVSFEAACTPAEKIVFTRSVYYDYYSTTSDILVMYSDGSNVTKIATGTNPIWSPSGKKVLYSNTICDYWYGCYGQGLSVIGVDGKDAVKLTNSSDSDPAWSPSSDKVAFVREGQIHVVSAAGGVPTRLALDSVRSAMSPVWSPSGMSIAFTCEVIKGRFDICVAGADGSGFHRLTADPWLDRNPVWSPDGTRIAFTTDRDDAVGAVHIAIMNADGGGFLRLSNGDLPVWSPNGTRIAFTTGNASGTQDVASMKPDGSDVVHVSAGFAPAWSQDGSRLVFVAVAGNDLGPGLQVVNANGTGRARLTNNQNDYAPAWRP